MANDKLPEGKSGTAHMGRHNPRDMEGSKAMLILEETGASWDSNMGRCDGLEDQGTKRMEGHG